MPLILNTLIAALLASAGGGSVTPRIGQSRIQGVAPLGVVFQGMDTTDVGTTNICRDLAFSWTFGDPDSGSPSNAAITTTNNQAYGPTCVHTFETPGIYTVTMTVKGTDGKTRTAQTVITVIDPAIAYPGTQTICISNGSDFSAAPIGCRQLANVNDAGATVAPFIADNIRILYNGGDTFTTSSAAAALNLGTHQNVRVSSFGTGNANIVNSSATVAFSCCIASGVAAGSPGNDVAISYLNMTANAANTNSQGVRNYDSNVAFDVETKGFLTVHKCNITNTASGIGFQGRGNVATSNRIVSNVGQAGNVSIFTVSNGCDYLGVHDNYMDRGLSGEHAVRLEGWRYLAVSSNYTKNIPLAKHHITLREMPGASTGRTCFGFTVTNNYMDAIGSSGAASHLQVQPVNSTTYGDFSDGVIDHNLFGPYDYSAGGTFFDMPAGLIQARRVTARHNAVNASSYDAAGAGAGISSGILFLNANTATPTPAPPADQCTGHHNTLFSKTKIKTALLSGQSQTTNGSFYDNLMYAPLSIKDSTGNGSQGIVVQTPVPASYTTHHNSTNAQVLGTDPQFMAAQPVLFADFALKPGTGSYALTGSSTGGQMGVNIDLAAI